MICFPSHMVVTIRISSVQMVKCPDRTCLVHDLGPYSLKVQETTLEAYLKYINLAGRICLPLFLEWSSLFRQA